MIDSFHYLGSMLLSGCLMGIVFDLYNTVTGTSKWLRWVRPVFDVTFWLASAIFVYKLSLVTDLGRFRIYTFGLILIGYLIYLGLLHRAVVGSANAVVRFVQLVLLGIWRLIHSLIVRPILAIISVSLILLKKLYQLGCWLENAAASVLNIVIRILLFPMSRFQRATTLRTKIVAWQEVIWTRLSNWLKKSPHGI